jgi:hypothetical protein
MLNGAPTPPQICESHLYAFDLLWLTGRDWAYSRRVAFVFIFIVLVFFFAVVILVFIVVGLFSNEDVWFCANAHLWRFGHRKTPVDMNRELYFDASREVRSHRDSGRQPVWSDFMIVE